MKATPTVEPQHFSFLAEGSADPRPAFMAELKQLLGERGSIVGYNTGFEMARLSECAWFLPEYQCWCDNVRPRFIDLLDIFERLDHYDPAQNGSASLKAVLPAVTGLSYDALKIRDGDTASREFIRITFTDVPGAERTQVRQQLEAYCTQDTQALMDILFALQRL